VESKNELTSQAAEKICPRWRLPKVAAMTGLGRSTIWAWVKDGRFPAPEKLGARVTVWSSCAVLEWLDKKGGSLNESN
jgi:predicted DNA-binding transcriptional regulator AlpA